MNRRRVNPYFVTEKWNYAPAARRKAAKAAATLERVWEFLLNTHDPSDFMNDDPAFRDALAMIRAAQKRVAEWEDGQHRLAKQLEVRQ